MKTKKATNAECSTKLKKPQHDWISKSFDRICPFTVSLEKGFGSKGKQQYKCTASETQSHNKCFHQMQRKNHWMSSKELKPDINVGFLPLTTFYKALHFILVMPVDKEAVIMSLEI